MSSLSELLNHPPVISGTTAREPLGGADTVARTAELTGGEAFNELYGWGAREGQAQAAAQGVLWKPDLTGGPAKLYLSGDEVRRFARLPVERRAKIQQRLDAAGLLPNGYVKGVWDGESQTAMAEAMTYANQRGTKWQTIVGELAAAPRATPDAETFKPAPFLPPDVNALAEHLQALAAQYVNRELDTDELQGLVDRMQGLYRRAHNVDQRNAEQMFDTEMGEGTGDDLEPDVDVAARASTIFRNRFEGEIELNEDRAAAAENADLLSRILGSIDEVA